MQKLLIAMAAAALALSGTTALGLTGRMGMSGDLSRFQRVQLATWSDLRARKMASSEADCQALAKARQDLVGQKLTIPREAAICLRAREAIDADLRQAMQPGHEFGESLDTWHAERRAVNAFCAYAMSVGVP